MGLAFALILSTHTANARNAPEVCDAAARYAASQTGVPLSVLLAITRTETGRKHGGKFAPWPWTVNMEGAGKWFDDVDQALAYVERHHSAGARSFDVGCFQLNYKWHGQNFSSIPNMFDPRENALYAASFLRDLYGELGDWEKAAGAYHSRTKKYADRYKKRFRSLRAQFLDQDGNTNPFDDVNQRILAGTFDQPATPVPTPVPRQNLYPLLQTGAARSMGSLVPVQNTPARPLFGAATGGTQ
ncbi:MAG: transglycosylase SLT domain-containing protein [Pseudomonadota bacterium]|nr:transglycosylase SLT domain-containing protein [Pseudomonadota bacterium]